jgi:pimeloyl-ACP methyl ester carboxylesterase
MLRDLRRRVCSALAVAVLAAGMVAAADSSFDSAGVRIHYTEEGSGDPVLLIHGYTVDAVRQWDSPGIRKGLAERYRVIAFDHRGHGQSGKPHDPSAYGEQMAEDAIRLLDHLKIRKAHIVGYSMGGFLTVELLTTHPDRFLTATLGGAGARLADAASFNRIAESLEQGKGIGPLVVALTPRGQQAPPPEQIDAISKMILSGNDPLALAAVSRSMSAVQPVEAKIRANRIPTLALIGEADPLKAGVDALDGVMPNLKIVVIPKADHITAPADPLFLKTLRAFLEEHSAVAARSMARQ